jgi:hypothetical protein
MAKSFPNTGATTGLSTDRTGMTGMFDGQVFFETDTKFVYVYNGTSWILVNNTNTTAYQYVTTLYFTSSNTFDKTIYPWLRALRVKCQAAGGAGGGAFNDNTGGSGGGGGGYAEKFITNIAGLSAGTFISVPAGGSGVTGGAGNNGGNTFFDTITASGGSGGSLMMGGGGGFGGNASGGDLNIPGGGGGHGGFRDGANLYGTHSSTGGGSFLGHGGRGLNKNTAGALTGAFGSNYGGGGSGGIRVSTSNAAGGNGAPGIVILELYA